MNMELDQLLEDTRVNNYNQEIPNRALSPRLAEDPRFNLFVEGLREKSKVLLESGCK